MGLVNKTPGAMGEGLSYEFLPVRQPMNALKHEYSVLVNTQYS
jgi:hypothetical protein